MSFQFPSICDAHTGHFKMIRTMNPENSFPSDTRTPTYTDRPAVVSHLIDGGGEVPDVSSHLLHLQGELLELLLQGVDLLLLLRTELLL